MYVPRTINDRSDDQSHICISSPAEFVAVIPALLGFRPEESVVAILMDGRRLICSMRADLGDDPTHVAEVIGNAASNGGANRALLAMYTLEDAETARAYADPLSATLATDGLLVGDALLVHPDRFWSLTCHDHECCPPEGISIPVGTTQFESEQVAQGRWAVAPSRQALAERYAPRPELVSDPSVYRMASGALDRPLAQRCEQAMADLRLVIAATHRPDHRLVDQGPVELARIRLTLLLDDVTVRDYLLAMLASAPGDPAAVEALTQMALTAPFEIQPALAATAATAQACIGGSPVAIWALLDLAPGNNLARLLTSAIHAGFTPSMIREALTSALPEIQARVAT